MFSLRPAFSIPEACLVCRCAHHPPHRPGGDDSQSWTAEAHHAGEVIARLRVRCSKSLVHFPTTAAVAPRISAIQSVGDEVCKKGTSVSKVRYTGILDSNEVLISICQATRSGM